MTRLLTIVLRSLDTSIRLIAYRSHTMPRLLTTLILCALVAETAAQGPARTLVTTPVTRTTFSSLGGLREWPDGHLTVSDPEANRLYDIRNGDASVLKPTREAPIVGRMTPWSDAQTLLYSRRLGGFLLMSAAGDLSDAPASLAAPPGIRINMTGDLYVARADGALFWTDPPRGASSKLWHRDAGGQVREVTSLRNPQAHTIREGGIGMSLPVPFTALDEWALGPDHTVVVVRGEPYRVEVIPPTGPARVGPERTVAGPRVTRQDRDNAARQRERAAQRTGLAGLPAPTMPDDMYPQTKAAFERGAVAVAPTGHVWVTRSVAADARATLVDVFDPAGVFVEQLALPRDARVMGVGEARVYLAVRAGESAWRLEAAPWR